METTTASALGQLTELIRHIDVAMLTTVDRAGHLHSRPMIGLREPSDEALWFFAHGSSHIVDDVQGHHPVNITYVDSARGRYVSVSGRGRVVNESARKTELWERRLASWFPKGPDDPAVVLIRVEVQEAEFWDCHSEREFGATVELKVQGGGVRNEKIPFH